MTRETARGTRHSFVDELDSNAGNSTLPGAPMTSMAATAVASRTLFKLDFNNGKLADTSGNRLAITDGSAGSIVKGAYLLNGKDGGNSIAIERDASLFSKDQMSLSLDLKSAAAGVGGTVFRMHTALTVDVTKSGQVVFALMENSAGKSGVIKSSGVNVADGQWHNVSLTYDAKAGKMIGYVDGDAVGHIRVSAATMRAEFWDPQIGSPWGDGFRGYVDNITIRENVAPPASSGPPVAGSDRAVTLEDKPLTLSESTLLANDKGGNLSITDVRIVSGHGSADVDSKGNVVYRPGADQTSDTVLEYTVENGQGREDTAKISVDVRPVNDAPTMDDATFSVLSTASRGTLVGRVEANDPENSAVKFAITDGNAGNMFKIDGAGRITVNNPNALDDRPTAAHTLSVKATDAQGASTTADIRVEVDSIKSLFAAAQDEYARPILVNDSKSFVSALNNAKGGETILLRPDVDYGGIVKSANPKAMVTVTSLDPGNAATITGLDLRSASHLTFDNLHFEYHGKVQANQADIIVTKGSDIRFTDSTFTGVAKDYADVGDKPAQNLLRVSDSRDFTFDNNEVSNYLHGVHATRTQDISIKNNEIHDMQGDGMRFAQVQDIDIKDNYFHDFLGSDAKVTHVDFIQFWTTNTKAPSQDITIDGNVFMSGEFQNQAIFFRDERGDAGMKEMRYQDVRITENVIYNGHLHGVTISNADDLSIYGNSLLSNPDGGMKPSINVANSTGVRVYDNVTSGLTIGSDNDVDRLSGNVLSQARSPNGSNYVDDLFVNPGQGYDARLKDFYVLPGSVLVKSDGTVVGSEQLRIPTRPDELNAVVVGTASESSRGTTYTFDARYTANEDGFVAKNDARFVWNFGDGDKAEGQRVSHAYDRTGEFQVILSVLHDDGSTDDARFHAIVDTASMVTALHVDHGSSFVPDPDPHG